MIVDMFICSVRHSSSKQSVWGEESCLKPPGSVESWNKASVWDERGRLSPLTIQAMQMWVLSASVRSSIPIMYDYHYDSCLLCLWRESCRLFLISQTHTHTRKGVQEEELNHLQKPEEETPITALRYETLQRNRNLLEAEVLEERNKLAALRSARNGETHALLQVQLTEMI
jgi:hypothetical protein